jgi:hypothetical protein
LPFFNDPLRSQEARGAESSALDFAEVHRAKKPLCYEHLSTNLASERVVVFPQSGHAEAFAKLPEAFQQQLYALAPAT